MSGSAPDIRDIHAPYLIPHDWRLAALFALGTLVLLLVLWWVWRRLRSRRRPLTLLQRTLARLEATRVLMVEGNVQGFSVAVSDVVRAYIEERFAVHATQRTTSEFLHDCLSQVGSALQAHEQALGEFLKYCDLAKFARWSLNVAEMQAMFESARHFIGSTAAPVPAQTLTDKEAKDVPIRQS